MLQNLKHKVRAVLPKPKLIVYIGRSQKGFQTRHQPEKGPFHFSSFNSNLANSEFLCGNFSNSIRNFQIKNVQIPNFKSQISISNVKFQFSILI